MLCPQQYPCRLTHVSWSVLISLLPQCYHIARKNTDSIFIIMLLHKFQIKFNPYHCWKLHAIPTFDYYIHHCDVTWVLGYLKSPENLLFWNKLLKITARNRQSFALTHWVRVTHICVGKITIIGSDNGLSPGRRQAIIWTNARILLIGAQGTNFSGILGEFHTFLFKKMHFKTSSAKYRPSCLSASMC